MKAKKFLAGSIVAGSMLAFTNTTNANSLFNFSSLGSGAEVRSELLNGKAPAGFIELKCSSTSGASGSTGSMGKTNDGKMKDGKCGEGKCGDKKMAKTKMKDGKCGEGKCGDKKANTKKPQ